MLKLIFQPEQLFIYVLRGRVEFDRLAKIKVGLLIEALVGVELCPEDQGLKIVAVLSKEFAA